jgi:two-component system, chemotaxis family, protein-glutamate methylesterase/glutaminase
MTLAEDKEPICPGTIYFAPPDYHLLVERGRTFALSQDERVHFSRPAVDVLFESAAEAYRDRVMGIILSGANADGAAGLRAVALAGGMTVVQSLESAEMIAMPAAALEAAPDSVEVNVSALVELLRVHGEVDDQ